MTKSKFFSFAILAAFMGGCSTVSEQADTGPTPEQVVASGEASGEVHWGGQIVQVKNLRDRTLIEVLALPLEGGGRPRADGRPQGRFIIEQGGFLEPQEYAPDRLLEVRGELDGFTSGRVGEAAYRYPVVRGDKLVLWPADTTAAGRAAYPRINFGVGVSNHGSGVGVGIGF
jgi:outer membrane lipoprotein